MSILFSVDAMVNGLIGGAMMGLAASVLLLFNGRVMGVCGIAHGIFYFQKENVIWRILFLLGLFIGGYLLSFFSINAFDPDLNLITSTVVIPQVVEPASVALAVQDAAGKEAANLAGASVETTDSGMKTSMTLFLISAFLTGFGTSLGTGCTTGHGVCGLSRLSLRGMAATMMFIMAGMATVFVMRHLL